MPRKEAGIFRRAHELSSLRRGCAPSIAKGRRKAMDYRQEYQRWLARVTDEELLEELRGMDEAGHRGRLLPRPRLGHRRPARRDRRGFQPHERLYCRQSFAGVGGLPQKALLRSFRRYRLRQPHQKRCVRPRDPRACWPQTACRFTSGHSSPRCPPCPLPRAASGPPPRA